MQFEITYVNPRTKKRIVNESRFEKSLAYAPVLKLKVGQSMKGGYWSAGIRSVKRLPDADDSPPLHQVCCPRCGHEFNVPATPVEVE
jgi:hypothetical protein